MLAAAFSVALAGSAVLLAAPTASALGTTHVKCTNYNTATGFSSTSSGGFTTNGGVCGTAKVRLFYRTHPGSPLYYTAWRSSTTTATVANPGNLVQGGNHGVSNPATLFSSAKNFSS